MGRILSALLILVLAFSHGPMSAAVPHLDGSTHSHARMVDADHHDDHAVDHDEGVHAEDDGVAQGDVASSDPGDFGKATHGLGHHSHVSTDGVPSSGLSFAARSVDRDRSLPRDDARLRSAVLEPLPEPPSA